MGLDDSLKGPGVTELRTVKSDYLKLQVCENVLAKYFTIKCCGK